MNFCHHCGEKLVTHSNFCPSCGHSLKTLTEPAAAKEALYAAPKQQEMKAAKGLRFGLFDGVIGIAAALAVGLGLLSLLDFEFYSFSVWFVLPVGGLIFGLLTTLFYFRGIIKRGFLPSKKHYLVSMLPVLISFFLLHFIEYQMAYVAEDNNEINHRFRGEHISNFIDEDENPMMFMSYVVYKLENSSSSVRVRYSQVAEFDSPTGYSVAREILNLVGFLLGGFLTGLISSSGYTHCTKCKQAFVTEHRIGEVSMKKIREYQGGLSLSIEEQDFPTFIQLVKDGDIHLNDDTDHDETYIIRIGSCPNCQQGNVIMKNLKRNREGDFEEIESRKIVIPIEGRFAREAMTYVKSTETN